MKKWLILLASILFMCGAAQARQEEFGPASTPLIPGIDVSAWQGDIDFEGVRAAGIEIVYIRAGEGGDYEDPYFERNASGAADAGLDTGYYYFMTASSEAEAIAQARHFAQLIEGYTPDCRLALDYGGADQLSGEALTQYARAFFDELEALTGLGAVLYTDAYAARERYDESLTDIPIWVADYGVDSPEPNGKWSSWIGWQYSDRGRVDGITGNVDLDRFTREIYINPPAPEPTPKNSTPQYAELTQGETLYTLAARYNVTVAELEQGNLIPPGGAREGQIMRIINAQPPAEGAAQSVFISPNDGSLADVARRFGVSADALMRVNELPSPARVYAGQVIKLPPIVSRETLVSAPDTLLDEAYVTQPGDTLASVAAQFGLTQSELARYNALRAGETIYAGQILKLSSYGAPAEGGFYGAYVVQRGDTLWAIARRFGVTIQALFDANAIRERNLIYLGQVLVIPRG